MPIATTSPYQAKGEVYYANDIQLVHSGGDYFDRLVDIINAAEHEIHLQTYSFNNDETGNRVADALIEAAERGVTIYMVLDAYGSKDFSTDFKKKVRNAGIQLRFFGRLGKRGNFAWGRRLHHKIVVVDRHITLVGGINISNRYSGHGYDWAWFDFALLVKGDVGQHVVRVCRQVYAQWFRRHRKNYPLFKGYEGENKEVAIQLRQNDWLRSKNQIAQSYAKAIKEAKEEIIIANSYFLPGGYFRRLLKDASQRGVKVKMLLPGISDVFMAKNAMHYLYRYLLRHNIEVYEWKPSILHAKIACIDGKWCTVGSYNLNYLSAYASIEFNISVLDERFLKEFCEHLYKLINSESVQSQDPNLNLKANPIKLFIYWASFRFLKLLEAMLISFPGQNFFKKNVYS